MVARSYTALLAINEELEELIPLLGDPHPTDDQLFRAQDLLDSMLADVAGMHEGDDGRFEIGAVASRLREVVLNVRRFRLRFEARVRTAVERALKVLDSVVSSRLSDKVGDSNVRQCTESLDALLRRVGVSVDGRRPRRRTATTIASRRTAP